MRQTLSESTAKYLGLPAPTSERMSVLHSDRVIEVNVEIMRAFVRLREMLATHKDLARKLAALEKKYDDKFKVVFEAIRQLMEPPPDKPKRRIVFQGK